MSTSIFSLPKTNSAIATSPSPTSNDSVSGSTFLALNNQTVTITTAGKPVIVAMQPEPTNVQGGALFGSGNYGNCYIRLVRNSVELARWIIGGDAPNIYMQGVFFIDALAPAGVNVYQFQGSSGSGNPTIRNMRTVAVEWG